MKLTHWTRPRLAAAVGAGALSLVFAISVAASFWPADDGDRQMGQDLFVHEWVPGDPLAAEGDGLGPVFNANSCAACHFQGGVGGSGPNEKNVLAFEVHPTPRRPTDVLNGAVHAAAISPDLQETRQQVGTLFPIVEEGERVIGSCTVIRRDFDPVQFFTVNTPALFGVGLIDRISNSAIRGNRRGRSVSGIFRELQGDFSMTSIGRQRVAVDGGVGKFGWKGQFGSVEQFVAAACAVEVGLTNPLRAQDRPGKHEPHAEAPLDLDSSQFRALVAFVKSLPRPQQVLPEDPAERAAAAQGETLFASVGCVDCHTPNVGGVEGVYSDFLLYNLTPDTNAGAYGRIERDIPLPTDYPKPNEWQTPPLWGVADSAPYFHDGASSTLHSAILRHDGNAKRVRENFRSLTDGEQQAVVSFLMTLRAPREASVRSAAEPKARPESRL